MLEGYGGTGGLDVFQRNDSERPQTYGLQQLFSGSRQLRCVPRNHHRSLRERSGGKRAGITHREVVRAVNRKKLRWFLVHHDVTVARQLLKQFRFDEHGNKKPFGFFRKTAILDDIRVLDMYESAIRHGRPQCSGQGTGFRSFSPTRMLRYIDAQFCDPTRLHDFLKTQRSP